MSYESNRIVIVGGGSAGWMTAATLINAFPNKDIVVIESDKIPTIGVGESTLSEFSTWLSILGIDKREMLRGTEGIFKFGLTLEDFVKVGGNDVHYLFGAPDLNQCRNGFEDWHIIKSKNKNLLNSDFTDYYWKHSYAVKTNKIPVEKNEFLEPFDIQIDAGFQINAIKFAEWLRENYCLPKGVKRIVSEVDSVKENENGIECLLLSNNDTISAGLFVDCTGFKSLLLGKIMKPKFIETKDYLPNNKAWFSPIQYTDKNVEMRLTTQCTALNNGWVWNTPLWSRIGSGYVFCDEYIDEDSALQEFKNYLNSNKMAIYNPNRSEEMNFRKIEIKNGYYENPWIKNVVAIGLSHGFLEPMESTGLMFIHHAALALAFCLSRDQVYTTWDSDRFNSIMNLVYESSFRFVSAHYALSLRDDTPYWKNITSLNYDKKMHNEIQKSMNNNISQVYVGYGFQYKNEVGYEHRKTFFDKKILEIEPFERVRRYKIKKANEYIDSCPTHYEYLRDNIYNES